MLLDNIEYVYYVVSEMKIVQFTTLLICMHSGLVCFSRELIDESYVEDCSYNIQKYSRITDKDWEDIPAFVCKSRTITVVEGGKAKFSCKTIHPTDEVSYFTKIEDDDVEVILFINRVQYYYKSKIDVDEDIYTLKNVSRYDAAIYSCSYKDGEVKISYDLDVLYPPAIKSARNRKKRVKKGETVFFFCRAGGNPKPGITWTKENGPLPKNSKDDKEGTLILRDAGAEEEGIYICTASNGIGKSDFATITLDVEYPPEESKKTDDPEINVVFQSGKDAVDRKNSTDSKITVVFPSDKGTDDRKDATDKIIDDIISSKIPLSDDQIRNIAQRLLCYVDLKNSSDPALSQCSKIPSVTSDVSILKKDVSNLSEEINKMRVDFGISLRELDKKMEKIMYNLNLV